MLVGVLVVVVVVLLARGGGDETPADTVARAFASDGAVETAEVELKLGLDGSAAAEGEPLLLIFRGPYSAGDAKTARFRFDVSLSEDGDPVGTLSGVDGRNYVTLGGQAYAMQAGALDDLKADGKADESITWASLGIDPRRWLRDPQRVGDEQWDGEDVVHVSADVDVDKLVADLKKVFRRADGSKVVGDEAKAAGEALDGIAKDVKSARTDLWVADGDGALRRMQVDLQLEDGRMAIEFALRAVGKPVEIEAPKDTRPFEELMTVVAAVAGQRGGTGTTTGPTPTTTTPAPEASGDGYAACVEAAAGDVAKLQDCAALAD